MQLSVECSVCCAGLILMYQEHFSNTHELDPQISYIVVLIIDWEDQ